MYKGSALSVLMKVLPIFCYSSQHSDVTFRVVIFKMEAKNLSEAQCFFGL